MKVLNNIYHIGDSNNYILYHIDQTYLGDEGYLSRYISGLFGGTI